MVSSGSLHLVGQGIDLAVRVGALRNSTLVEQRYFTSALGFWAAPYYLLRTPEVRTANDLAAHRLVRISQDRRVILKDGDANCDLETRPSTLLVNDMQTSQTYAKKGAGIALLPLFSHVEANRSVRILPQVQGAPFTVRFLEPRRKTVSPKVRAFLKLALQNLRLQVIPR